VTYDVIARTRRARRARRLRLAAALALLAGLALAVVVIALQPVRPAPGVGQPVQLNPGSAGGAPATAGVGGQPAAGTAAPLPADLTWGGPVAGVSLPVSAAAGPRDTGGGLARGFAHTRAGSVLAAVHLVVRVTPQVGPAVFGPTLRDQVVGAAAAALAGQVNEQYRQLCDQAHVGYGPPVGALPAVLAGYRIELFTDTTATVRVMTRTDRAGGAPLYAAAVIQLSWTGADWALLAPAGGVWDQSLTRVDASNVGGYNPFTPGR
jgi:hypothetical protein